MVPVSILLQKDGGFWIILPGEAIQGVLATWRTAVLEGKVLCPSPGKASRVGRTGQKGHSLTLHVSYLMPGGPVQLEFVDLFHLGCGN